jgi:hypothetical protein
LALTNPLQELPQLLGINVRLPPDQPSAGSKSSALPQAAHSNDAATSTAAGSFAKLSSAAPMTSPLMSSLGQAYGVFPKTDQITPASVKEHILASQSIGDTKRWELLGMPSGFGQQAHISAEQRARLLQRVDEVFELRSRFSAQGSFVFRMAEVVVSALAAVIHLNSGPEFHSDALACGRRACMEAESMGSVIMFMRPDFTSAILFLCELFFWLKDNVWLERMCALMKELGERVPAILPGCVRVDRDVCGVCDVCFVWRETFEVLDVARAIDAVCVTLLSDT